MTSKEKAIDLVYRFSNAQSEDGFVNSNKYRHKECALIAVNEILNYIEHMNIEFNLNLSSSDWQKVKQEIENL